MGIVPDLLKFSFRRSSTINSSDPPPEFLCPISNSLMSDPVILPSGDTFDRLCIQSFLNLSLPSSSPLLLIPNSALRSAIFRWCDIAGIPPPIPISPQSASNLALKFLPSSPITSSSPSSSSSDHSSSSEIGQDSPEDQILPKLNHPQIPQQKKALFFLLELTRESPSRRLSLASSAILAALRRLLLSPDPAVKSAAAAVTVNLSLEPPNKIPILRSGAVPPIIRALQSSTPHAAGALFSLAIEPRNRAAIGVLGAVPPLLRVFCDPTGDSEVRLEAGMAIHCLVLAEMNMAKLARVAGAARGLAAVAMEGGRELRKVAMRVMVGMAGSREGKAAMLDGGAVEAAVEMLRREDGEEREMAVAAVRVVRGEEVRGRIFWEEERRGDRRRMNRDSGGGSGSNSSGF